MKLCFKDRTCLDSFYDSNQYVQKRSLRNVPDSIIKDVQLVSIGPGVGNIFGSYNNRIADTFGDIDVIQEITGKSSAKELAIETARKLQDVVKLVHKTRKTYFSELKAGINTPYHFNIGTLQNGIFRPAKDLWYRTETLYRLDMLTLNEYRIVQKALKHQKLGGAEYDTIFELFRRRFLLRWSEQEVLDGYKMIETGKYPLYEALLDNTILKLDIIKITPEGRYMEVTNFMMLGINKGNYIIPLNYDAVEVTPAALPVAIEELYYSDASFNPFKLAKRCFAYLMWVKNFNKDNEVINGLIDRYAKVLKSTVNIMYSMTSELDAMRIVLGRKNSPKANMKRRLNQLKSPLANVLELKTEDLARLTDLITRCITQLNKENISKLIYALKDVIFFWTMAYFDQLGLNPVPRGLLPKKMRYNPNIYREPWDRPVSPLDLAALDLDQSFYKGKKKGGGPNLGPNWTPSAFQKLANTYRKARNLTNPKVKSRPLELGEFHIPGHNWSGPGTRVDLHSTTQPINNIDACSMKHDQDYDFIQKHHADNPEKQRELVRLVDAEALKCYDRYPDEQGYALAKAGIGAKATLAESKWIPKVARELVSRGIFGDLSGAGKSKEVKKEERKEGAYIDDGKVTWVLD